MRKIVKYVFFSFLLVAFILLDGHSIEKIRLSLIVCVCFSLYSKGYAPLIVSALCGLLCDMTSLTLPYFSCTYLYISLGCVWGKEMFLGLKAKNVFWLSIFSYFVFYILCHTINMITYAKIYISAIDFSKILINSLIMAMLSLPLYYGFKRLKF